MGTLEGEVKKQWFASLMALYDGHCSLRKQLLKQVNYIKRINRPLTTVLLGAWLQHMVSAVKFWQLPS